MLRYRRLLRVGSPRFGWKQHQTLIQTAVQRQSSIAYNREESADVFVDNSRVSQAYIWASTIANIEPPSPSEVIERLSIIADTEQLLTKAVSVSDRRQEVYSRQILLEEEQVSEAVKHYQESYTKMRNIGKVTSMKRAKKVLLNWYEPLVAALQAELSAIASGVFADDRTVSCHIVCRLLPFYVVMMIIVVADRVQQSH